MLISACADLWRIDRYIDQKGRLISPGHLMSPQIKITGVSKSLYLISCFGLALALLKCLQIPLSQVFCF
jgi:hypothetical protein